MGFVNPDDVPLAQAPVVEGLNFLRYGQKFQDFPTNITEFLTMLHTNHETRNTGAYIAALVVMTMVAVLVVGMRIWIRKSYHKVGLWWDDYLICTAVVVTLVWVILMINGMLHAGFGRHVYESSLNQLDLALKLQLSGQLLLMTATTLARCSIVCFLIRITPPTSATLYQTLIITLVMFAVHQLIQLGVIVTECRPYAATWDVKVRHMTGACTNREHTWIALSLFWVLGDIWVVILPVLAVWRLAISPLKKLGFILLLGFGGSAVIVSIVKLFLLDTLFDTWDPTYKATPFIIWCHAELCIGLIASSLPALTMLLRERTPGWIKRRLDQHAKNYEKKRWESHKGSLSTTDTRFSVTELESGRHMPKGIPDKDGTTMLELVPPDAPDGKLQTTIQALQPLPERDCELYIHYGEKGAMANGPAPAFRFSDADAAAAAAAALAASKSQRSTQQISSPGIGTCDGATVCPDDQGSQRSGISVEKRISHTDPDRSQIDAILASLSPRTWATSTAEDEDDDDGFSRRLSSGSSDQASIDLVIQG